MCRARVGPAMALACVAAALLNCPAAQGGLVTLLAQDRSVSAAAEPSDYGAGEPPDSDEQSAVGFGPFSGYVSATAAIVVVAEQGSSLEVSDRSAHFQSSSSVYGGDAKLGQGRATSMFSVSFALSGPARYEVDLGVGGDCLVEEVGACSFQLLGPDTLILKAGHSSGTLPPGTYNLTAFLFADEENSSNYDLGFTLDPTSSVPLPPAAWTGLGLFVLAIAPQANRRRDQRRHLMPSKRSSDK